MTSLAEPTTLTVENENKTLTLPNTVLGTEITVRVYENGDVDVETRAIGDENQRAGVSISDMGDTFETLAATYQQAAIKIAEAGIK